MKVLLIIFIALFFLGLISIGFVLLCSWILKNKKGTKIWDWVNRNIITETDLEL